MFDMILMAGQTAAPNNNMFMIVMMVALVGMMFFTSRSRKKQDKEAQQIRESMEVGDEVITIGGIVGRVVKVEDTTILMESGADRSKIRLTKSAISHNTTSQERVNEIRQAATDAKAAEKEAKKNKK